ncbi:MAG: cytochrome c oxidase assembly protein [Chromatiales bacterium]|nr:cytochrome c oxidase assembly protein [Chromatiales bacterium]
MVPLYDVICEITGMNGNDRRSRGRGRSRRRWIAERTVTVEFVANRDIGQRRGNSRPHDARDAGASRASSTRRSFCAQNLTDDAHDRAGDTQRCAGR